MTASKAEADPGSLLAQQMERAAQNRQALGQSAGTVPKRPRTLQVASAPASQPAARILVSRIARPVREAIRGMLRPSKATLWESRLPTLDELCTDALRGDWMPGEQHRWLERLGVAYGLIVGVGCSALLYGLAWLLQRPGRAAAALVIAGVLWVSLKTK